MRPQDVIVELIRGYHAFGVHGDERPDPASFFADPATSESMVKNSLTTSLAIISDIIMACRTPPSSVVACVTDFVAGLPNTERLRVPSTGHTHTRKPGVGRYGCARQVHARPPQYLTARSPRDLVCSDSSADPQWRHSGHRRRLSPRALLLHRSVRPQLSLRGCVRAPPYQHYRSSLAHARMR